jgi:MFS family permease
VRRYLADTRPLRVPDFRRIYIGQGISLLGSQLTLVAVPYQVYVETNSSAAVGLVSLCQLVPLLIGSLVGGVVADSMDRRKLMLISQLALAVTSVALALNAALDDPLLWPIVLFSSIAAGLSGLERPARAASIPAIVGLDLFPAAHALWQILFQIGALLGPAVAGLLLAGAGLQIVYWVDALTFVVAFFFVLPMQSLRVSGGIERPSAGAMAEGLRFAVSKPELRGVFLSDLAAMVFGMPRALFPALGITVFGGPAAVGLLYAAPGAGALIGAIFTGAVGRVSFPGRATIWCIVVWGAAMAAFGTTTWLPLALVFLAIAGAADVFSAVFRNTILQLSIPDSMRGRMSSVQLAVVTGGPRLGDFESGAVAALAGPRFSVVSGGVACVVAIGLLAVTVPAFRTWRLPAPRRIDPETEHSAPGPIEAETDPPQETANA